MPRILLVYATREGQTEKVAMRITEHLQNLDVNVQIYNAKDADLIRNIELNSFDLLVFGGSMHAGGIEEELINFINENAHEISSMPRSFFLVVLSAATKDPELRESWLADARDKMNQQLAVEFTEVEMIAGALAYSKYSFPLKWVMRRIAAKAGEGTDISRDYEYTNWEQVERYAHSLVNKGNPQGKT